MRAEMTMDDIHFEMSDPESPLGHIKSCISSPLRLERYRYEEHALAVELVSQLPVWSPVYARELKQTNKVQRQSRNATMPSSRAL